MKTKNDDSSDTFGLLACGSSGCWTVDLDESSDGSRWSLQLDGPHVYLVCEVLDLHVVKSAVDFLRSSQNRADALPLGCFNSAAVTLNWDNEDVRRCFLIVGATNRSALCVTLSAEDTAALAAALEQVLEDLPAELVK